jgi:hypothetical protein
MRSSTSWGIRGIREERVEPNDKPCFVRIDTALSAILSINE